MTRGQQPSNPTVLKRTDDGMIIPGRGSDEHPHFGQPTNLSDLVIV